MLAGQQPFAFRRNLSTLWNCNSWADPFEFLLFKISFLLLFAPIFLRKHANFDITYFYHVSADLWNGEALRSTSMLDADRPCSLEEILADQRYAWLSDTFNLREPLHFHFFRHLRPVDYLACVSMSKGVRLRYLRRLIDNPITASLFECLNLSVTVAMREQRLATLAMALFQRDRSLFANLNEKPPMRQLMLPEMDAEKLLPSLDTSPYFLNDYEAVKALLLRPNKGCDWKVILAEFGVDQIFLTSCLSLAFNTENVADFDLFLSAVDNVRLVTSWQTFDVENCTRCIPSACRRLRAGVKSHVECFNLAMIASSRGCVSLAFLILNLAFTKFNVHMELLPCMVFLGPDSERELLFRDKMRQIESVLLSNFSYVSSMRLQPWLIQLIILRYYDAPWCLSFLHRCGVLEEPTFLGVLRSSLPISTEIKSLLYCHCTLVEVYVGAFEGHAVCLDLVALIDHGLSPFNHRTGTLTPNSNFCKTFNLDFEFLPSSIWVFRYFVLLYFSLCNSSELINPRDMALLLCFQRLFTALTSSLATQGPCPLLHPVVLMAICMQLNSPRKSAFGAYATWNSYWASSAFSKIAYYLSFLAELNPSEFVVMVDYESHPFILTLLKLAMMTGDAYAYLTISYLLPRGRNPYFDSRLIKISTESFVYHPFSLLSSVEVPRSPFHVIKSLLGLVTPAKLDVFFGFFVKLLQVKIASAVDFKTLADDRLSDHYATSGLIIRHVCSCYHDTFLASSPKDIRIIYMLFVNIEDLKEVVKYESAASLYIKYFCVALKPNIYMKVLSF